MRSHSLNRLVSFAQTLRYLPPDHAIVVLARTYILSLSLSLGPAIVSILASKRSLVGVKKAIGRLIVRHLSWAGFPFSITLALAGRYLPHFLLRLDGHHTQTHTSTEGLVGSFATSYIAMALLQHGRRNHCSKGLADTSILPLTVPQTFSSRKEALSPTWDLTLIILVRALDTWVQRGIKAVTDKGELEDDAKKDKLTGNVDAAMFWVASSRIMWCFFYEPTSLPASYLKWIGALANLDHRLAQALRDIRSGAFSYVKGTTEPGLLTSMAADMGCPPTWGDPQVLPAHGGPSARSTYRTMGAKRCAGGIPCELVHGDVNHQSCVANAWRRGAAAFLKALLIYSPVHFLPVLLTQPWQLLKLSKLMVKTTSVLRSSLFLSTFVGSIWMTVCLIRTLAIAQIFPSISHDVYDGPFGCVLAGCLMCGSSIFIEDPRRRGEMATYVLPRAIRTCLPEKWMRKNYRLTNIIERITFALSISSLLWTQQHQPESLRGLSKWTLGLVTKGNVGNKADKIEQQTK